MTQMLSPGRSLLAHVAQAYRANPDSWCRGWGERKNGRRVPDRGPNYEMAREMERCCMDVALIKYGPKFGGQAAVDEARKLICAHLGVSNDRNNIHTYNDVALRTVREVIGTLEGAAGVSIVPGEDIFSKVARLASETEKKVAVTA